MLSRNQRVLRNHAQRKRPLRNRCPGTITSPNAERIRVGMPVPVITRAQDSTRQVEMIQYPPQPELGEGDVTITDTTPAAREAFRAKR